MDHPLEQQKDVDTVTQEVTSDPSAKRLSKVESVTNPGVPVNSADGLLKRRSLGDFLGSVSSYNTLKKRCRSPEACTNMVGSNLSTESPTKGHDHAASDNAPPTLPKLPPSGDLATSFQRNLEADPEAVTSGVLTSRPPGINSTRHHRRDQAVQTLLTSTPERTDATGERGSGLSVPKVPEMIDLYTGRQLVWNAATSADPRSVQTHTPGEKREETIQEEVPMLLQVKDKKRKELGLRPCTNPGTAYTTVDPLQAVYESKLIRGPRLEYKRKIRHSLGEDENFDYSSGSVWRKDKTSNGATAAGNDINVPTGADDDITDISSKLGCKNLKKKAKSLTFIRQLEVQPRGSSLTAPRRISFEMDLRGTDSGAGGAKDSFHHSLKGERVVVV
ncbi:hypothetical protein CSHISOI_01840 [Colletotrichum shisoi]|uniref:Uncharacterized protein n=1 Tax=Colletotrichum shisoi TaxID=2078593 RepID=A0A5Q4C2Q4_9PEZI|nr:hypothetical protein CSHISOI_01840 [Colletotrichum shisoi]